MWDSFITDFNTEISLTSKHLENSFQFRKNVPAIKLTTMGVGGIVALIFESDSEDVVSRFVRYCNQKKTGFRILGNGSNLILPDGGITNEVIIHLTHKTGYQEITKTAVGRELESEGTSLSAPEYFRLPAGASLMSISRELTNRGFSGIEFAAGIPATVGGAVRMNAGAHGESFAQVIRAIKILKPTGEVQWLQEGDFEFSYRHSNLPVNSIILEVDISLEARDPSIPKAKRAEALRYRKNTQPLTYPSSGSVFKNPLNHQSAGALLESLGYKGRSLGGLKFSEIHANWIIRDEDRANASSLRELVNSAKRSVKEAYDIDLTEELIFWDS